MGLQGKSCMAIDENAGVCRGKVVLAWVTAFILLLLAICPVTACGGMFPQAVFSHMRRPDLPLTRYAAGELGILQPTFARSYLAVAYLYLTERKLKGDQQAQAAKLWWHRLADLGTGDLDGALQEWLSIRKKVTSQPAGNFDYYRHISDQNFVSYINFLPPAYLSAANTLRSKLARPGTSLEAVKDWVSAQDKVFSISSQPGESGDVQAVPSALPAGADPELQADRAYQIACAHFYTQKFEKALQEFKAIAGDKGSPWSKLATYLTARVLVRAATLAPSLDGPTAIPSDGGGARLTGYDCLRKAKSTAESIISSADLSEYHDASRQLLGYVGARLDPMQRLKELSQLLLSGHDTCMEQDLADYSILLDQICPPPDEDAVNTDQATTPTSFNSGPHSGLPETDHELDLKLGFLSAAILLGAALLLNAPRWQHPNGTRLWFYLLALSLLLTPACLTACVKNAPNMTQKAATSQAAVPDDELSQWVLNYQLKTPVAKAKAYSEWKRSGSTAWLISTASKIQASDPQADEILSAAAKVPSGSPAYLTLAFHRIRLLAARKKVEESLNIMKPLLALPVHQLPPSARNLLAEQGLSLARTPAEFRAFAFQSPSSLGIMPLDDALPENESADELKKLEKAESFADNPLCLPVKSADIINFSMPLSTMANLVSESSLPKRLRLDLVQAVWVRSVMLKHDEISQKMIGSLRSIRPQLGQLLTEYEKAAPGAEKDFVFASIVLKNAAMRPYVSAGPGRYSEFNILDDYGDNWWAATGLDRGSEATGEQVPAPPDVNFLSDTEKRKAASELASIKTAGTAPNYLAKLVLAWADNHPQDSRLPEALYRTVRATKLGRTDSDTTKFSKRAFLVLHKHFRGNVWTEKTPYFY
jgi:hypothetical protein